MLVILVQGEVSVMVDNPRGQLVRLSTLSAGMSFGEMSLLDGSPRTAFVRADRDGACWVLRRDAFTKLDEADPRLEVKLLSNMLRTAARTAARLTTEVALRGV